MTILKKALKVLLVIVLVLCILLGFLIAPAMTNKKDLSSYSGVQFAHRGYFDNESDAPENSLPAFEKAIENGSVLSLMFSFLLTVWQWFSTMLTLKECVV